MAEVSRCESGFHQFTKDGNVLRGNVVRADIGVMQINATYHGEEAQNLGYDIYTLDGNLAFAKWLYNREGTAPWSASEFCWSR